VVFQITVEREDDGQWIADVAQLPGVSIYGASQDEAIRRIKALTFRVLADRLDSGDGAPELDSIFVSER
jgi:predicted RNase H-like HicB family nuclease